ncbi:hypothetical protein TrRE_jg130 [Triparma retinervis]|uniref:EGF-like domain-containing protein n=1 Tax=Triparma retinervis TaxID=2557542 RepID=A0A9W6ZA92_9STRA|nr:hypothetical protein TrRE_jg130 [Triparma retinervis]
MTNTGANGLCECPPGYYEFNDLCNECGFGFYRSAKGATSIDGVVNDCDECPHYHDGYITTTYSNATSINECICPNNMIMTDTSMRECKCSAGTHMTKVVSEVMGKPSEGACTSCEEDKFTGASNLDTECTTCADAKGDDNVGTRGATGASALSDCLCTDDNMIIESGVCVCKPGYLMAGGLAGSHCEMCEVGKYKESASSSVGDACDNCMDLDQNTNTMSTGSNSPSACVCADATRMVSLGGSRSQDDCICTDEFHEKVPDEPEWDADLVGKCACKLGYFWDNTIDACTHCAADFYRATYLIPVATSDGAGGFTFGSQDSCSACSAFDSNSITNGTTAASSTESCVCRDANMEKMEGDGKCGCKPGYYFDDTAVKAPFCLQCPAEYYSITTSLANECNSCYSLDAHSYTNGTIGASSEEDCICHTEMGFIHDPNYVEDDDHHGHFAPCVCEAGTYWNGGEECVNCPIGQYQHYPGLDTSCYSCLSNITESRSNSNFMGYFSGVMSSTTEEVGADSPEFCGCSAGYFDLGHQCHICSEGHNCYLLGEGDQRDDFGLKVETLVVDEGYWRPYPGSAYVFECVHAESCVGSLNGTGNFGDGICEEGHTGPYCDICNASYAKDTKTGECIKCNPEATTAAQVLAGSGFAAVVILFSYFAYRTARGVIKMQEDAEGGQLSDEDAAMLIAESKSKVMEMKAKMAKMKAKQQAYVDKIKKYQKMYKSARTPLKIFISFFQISSGLPKTLEIKFPVSFTQILHKFNFINLDVAVMFAESCIIMPNFYDELFFLTCGPLVLGGILLLITGFCFQSKSPFLEVIGDEVFKIFLLGTYLIMPGATVKIFTTFRCDDDVPLDGGVTSNNVEYGSYLKADYARLCYSTSLDDDTGELVKTIDPDYSYWWWYSVDIHAEQGGDPENFGVLLLLVNSAGPAMLVMNSFLNGDMKKKYNEKYEKAIETASKHKGKLLCCAGTVGAAIADIDSKKKAMEEKAEAAAEDQKKRPEEFAVKKTMELWEEQKKKKEEESRRPRANGEDGSRDGRGEE